MITNEAGEVAMAHHQPAQAFVSENRTPSRTAYVFVVQRAVSLTYVKPEDVDTLLAIRAKCCNGQKRLFAPATEGQVGVWTNGGKPCGC